ncbi:hypothetical protein ZIOFF_021476 [Zingiber officinale]|uniref:Uncharacterized protein n=1 Tax=Zingiber officinale TaxID=94328 RepID=A0A8J5LH13_ZINOF|nr:hypothetical protein ZIOFF_021476 [Zingiber officinale]
MSTAEEAEQPELPSVASSNLYASAPSDVTIPNPNFVRKLNPIQSDFVAGHSQNGVIPVQILPAVSPSNAPFFTPVHMPLVAASVSDERRSLAVVAMDGSHRLFQRLWTDEEEIKILQGSNPSMQTPLASSVGIPDIIEEAGDTTELSASEPWVWFFGGSWNACRSKMENTADSGT